MKMLKYWWLTFVAGFLIVLTGAAIDSEVLSVIGVLVMIIGDAFCIAFCTCPHCGHFLDARADEVCPHCGEMVVR